MRLSIYPNPVQNQVSISLDLPEPQYGTIDIYTIHGKRVFHHDPFLFSSGRPPFALDISSFPNGLYLVVIQLDGKEYSGKFVNH